MATVSNAGAGMSFSNAQQGTRGLSAGDWIRLQRLRGARANGRSYSGNGVVVEGVLSTNKDIAPPQFPQDERHNMNGAINLFPVVGTSKIRRPASNWTDFVASQTADYVLKSQAATTGTSVKRTLVKLCNCASTTLNTKTGNCEICHPTTKARITLY